MFNWFKKKRFDSLISENINSLLRFAYARCNDKLLSEDLVQETCLKAYKSYLDKSEEIVKPKEWLFRILVNTHISYLRKKQLNEKGEEMENKKNHVTVLVVTPQGKKVMLNSRTANAYYQNIPLPQGLISRVVCGITIPCMAKKGDAGEIDSSICCNVAECKKYKICHTIYPIDRGIYKWKVVAEDNVLFLAGRG